MKTKIRKLLAALLTLSAVHHAAAQGTAFTYQGQLQNNGAPVNGTYNFSFALYNAPGGGSLIAGPDQTNGVIVTNGLFTVTLDFGAGVWIGSSNNWLQVGVETNGSSPFSYQPVLTQLTPVPQAIFAENAGGLTATLPLAQLPPGVVTNYESGVVLGTTAVGSLTVGALNLPWPPAAIEAGGNSLLYADVNANLFLGLQTGNQTLSGLENTGIGDDALANDGTGSYNTAIGLGALQLNTSGNYNTANGFAALTFNGNGSNNTANGADALYENQTGSYNTANGSGALQYNTSGGNNTANGYVALKNNNGNFNTANGAGTLEFNNNGADNTADGYASLQNNTSGSDNTANGFQALKNNIDGAKNSANGSDALYANTSGTFNTANGYQALYSNTNGGANVANGYQTLKANLSGNNNVASGVNAMYGNTTGNENTADGYGALEFASRGSENTAVGFEALADSETNAAFSYNVAIGAQAMQNGTDIGAVAIGYGALQNDGSLGLYTSLNNYSGGMNTAVGYTALGSFTTGTNNAALGANAGGSLGAGNNNTALGGLALSGSTSGSGNIALGSEAGVTLGAGNDNIYIGNPGNGNESGAIRIGTQGTQGTTVIAGIYGGSLPNNGTAVPVYVDASGHLGPNPSSTVTFPAPVTFSNGVTFDSYPNAVYISCPNNPAYDPFGVGNCWCDGISGWYSGSDRNMKSGFEPLDAGAILAKVAAMPITRWHYTNDLATPHIGPMAQDFYAAFAIGRDDRHIGNLDEAGVALAAIQGLDQKVRDECRAKDDEIGSLKDQNELLTQRLNALEQMVHHLAEKN
jgi:Chaperone of endosialidase